MSNALGPALERAADARDVGRTTRDHVPRLSALSPLDAARCPAGGPLEGTTGAQRAGALAAASRFDAFRLDTVNEYLWRGDVPVELTPKAFAMLRYLVEHAGRLVTHRELLEALWPETYVQPEILKTYVRDIRKVLADDPRAPRFIRTRARRGYHFIAPVSREGFPEPAGPGGSPSPAPADWAAPRRPGPDPMRPARLVQFPRVQRARADRGAAAVAGGSAGVRRVRPLPTGGH